MSHTPYVDATTRERMIVGAVKRIAERNDWPVVPRNLIQLAQLQPPPGPDATELERLWSRYYHQPVKVAWAIHDLSQRT